MNTGRIERLKGYSGCDILLTTDSSEFSCIKKISKNTSYNKRLILQYNKQKKFTDESIKTPKIIDCGYFNNLFYFNMEYIISRNLSDIIETLSNTDIEFYGLLISNFINKNKIKSIKFCNPDKVYNKIKQLENYCKYSTIDKLYNMEWNKIPESLCHGDLTFENILINQSSVYFIDFLDSFIDSWMIDVAKIFQDTRLLWSNRYNKSSIELIQKLKYIEQIIISELNITKQEIYTIEKILYLNINRILPYAVDKNMIVYLNKQIKFLEENSENFNNTMCRKIE